MKKIIITLIILQTLAFSYGAEKSDENSSPEDYSKIEKISGIGFYKNGEYLGSDTSFLNALSSIPEAEALYAKHVKWKTAGGILIATATTTYGALGVGTIIGLLFSSTYGKGGPPPDPIIHLYGLIPPIILLPIFIPQLVMMIVSFRRAVKYKKEAIKLYNEKINERKTSIKFNGSPILGIDENKQCTVGALFSLRF